MAFLVALGAGAWADGISPMLSRTVRDGCFVGRAAQFSSKNTVHMFKFSTGLGAVWICTPKFFVAVVVLEAKPAVPLGLDFAREINENYLDPH